jgi:hypothetical protein
MHVRKAMALVIWAGDDQEAIDQGNDKQVILVNPAANAKGAQKRPTARFAKPPSPLRVQHTLECTLRGEGAGG